MSAIPESKANAAAPGLPSGTVTFAFTDIEGSTARWERDRAAMQEALRRHDELLRAAVSAQGGHVFKTVGDAFCCVFARPEDAVAAMLDAQRALAAADFSAVDGLPVRAAVHTGTADERGGDYFGPAVNRVARLLGIAHGGQILVSGVASDLVLGDLPPQASLRDLGAHRLKDLARPEQVYQLLAPGLTPEFPPLRSLETLPNNLPLQLTSFVGRDHEVAKITALLATHRLVTIVGSGGVGKTRTSLQVGANLLDGSGDGVWFVELAPLSGGAYVPTAVAQAMGIVLEGTGDPIELLLPMLKSKRALLIFDNCEHLVEAASRVIAALIRGCPQLSVLASTRQALGIAGEATFRMPSLEIPAKSETALTAAQAASAPAIALFVDRAAAVDDRFALTDENAGTIAEICRRLDGIPLAIELAAARVKILSPRQLRERLDERFRVLTGGSRDALPRQQTLRALIDWSHDLLDEREQMLFRRLGIFVSGFTMEGAAAVAAGDDLDELDLFDLLASLVDKSLVLAEPDGDSLRYRMLESTRAYARERLATAGEDQSRAARHLHHLRDLFVGARTRSDRTGREAEFERLLETELEEVRAALDWAADGPDAELGGELLASVRDSWSILGLEGEGVARCERYIALLPSADPRTRSGLQTTLAFLLSRTGKYLNALDVASEAVRLARASADAERLASALFSYALVTIRLRRFAETDAALAEAEALAPPEIVRLRLILLDRKALRASVAEREASGYEELRKRHAALGNARLAMMYSVNLAESEHAQGHSERAVTIAQAALPGLRLARDRAMFAVVLSNLTGYLIALDRFPEARETAREAIVAGHAHNPEHFQVAIVLEHAALLFALAGDHERAAQLAGYSEAAFKRTGFERETTETRTRTRLEALLRERLGPEELAPRLAQGEALTSDDAIALALQDA
ncbi:MAG: ATP-binding protein [Vulcanimicrobiaceae bacterium]